MDSSTWIPAVTALLGTVVGGGISELGQWRRSRVAEVQAKATRDEARQWELWDASQPAAARVRERFTSIVRGAEPPPFYKYEDDYEISFEEGFPEWWEDQRKQLEGDIALIPSSYFRTNLSILKEAASLAPLLRRYGGYPLGYKEAVHVVAQAGFDVISAWMRGEQVLDRELGARVDEIAAWARRTEENYQANHVDSGVDD